MFKLEESSIPRHANERCLRIYDDSTNKINELDNESQPSIENKSDDKNDVEIEVNNDSNSEDESNALHFPDTHVKFTTLSSQLSTESGSNKVEIENNENEDEESAIIYAVAQQAPRKNRVIQKTKDKQGNKKKQQQQQQLKHQVEENNQNEPQNDKQKSGLKRGQRSKLKKIKEKYKDQDEEEKLKRMEILKSAGNKKNEAVKNTVENEDSPKSEIVEKRPAKPIQKPKSPKPEEQKPENKPEEQSNELDVEPEAEEDVAGDGNDLELLNSLTGCPHELDELLFALPVVAPYAALHNYK